MKKYKNLKLVSVLAAVALAAMLSGCDKSDHERGEISSTGEAKATSISPVNESIAMGDDRTEDSAENKADGQIAAEELEVRFGDEGEPFVLRLEDNATAAAIAGYVGTADWRLPIYHYDDYDSWEVMQYYDIPDRYEIPSGGEMIASQKAGEVYYSEPNRIILFYRDGEISGEYTKIGSIESTEAFCDAVENNPVLEGWSNKIVLINSRD